jgi:hypothetical protein
VKLIVHLLLALNFIIATPAFAGPGGTTTPFPFGQAPEDLVGTWVNPSLNLKISVEHVRPVKGQTEKLFVVVTQGGLLRKGYMYFTGTEYCGVLFGADSQNLPICLKGRYGLLAMQSQQSRLYFTQERKPLKK